MKNNFLALCILLLAGCTKADVESVSYQEIDSPQFYAEFAESDTRTFVDEKVRLLWNEADLLTIFTTTLNQKYQFDGETGDNSGTFSQISVPQFGTGNNISANYAVYPYSEEVAISNDEVITLSLPATQQYAEDSFGPDANTMVAVTSGINDYFLPFKNVGGFLRLRLYGEGVTVKSIQLQGNNEEKIAGKATVVAKYGKNPELEMSDDATETITLDCGDGVELGATADDATDFWFVVPPTTFAEGFTITITDTEGLSMTKSTTKEYVVERNVLKSMSAFEVEEAELSIPYNQIWYTSSNGEIVTTHNAFGASIVSNVYENGKGVITFDGNVTMIGNNAFFVCPALTSITIPKSVTSIGEQAFYGCSALASITIPNSVTSIGNRAFNSCDALASITIPNSVTSIGDSAFGWCDVLTNITIPNSVISIGKEAFANCDALTSITIPDSVTSIGNSAFNNCSALETFYGKYASADNRCLVVDGVLNSFAPAGLTSYNIPDNVTEIGSATFWNCEALASVTIPGSVTSIGGNAFSNCSALTCITIPNNVTSIGNSAFFGCTALTSITISDKATSIGKNAFSYCSALTSITIPDSVTSIGNSAFSGCSALETFYGKYASADNRCLVVDGVLNSFAPAELTSYNIPENVTSIGNGAFEECKALISITISESVTSIGTSAFRNCKALKSITIPDSVTSIEASSFFSCNALANIYCKATVPPTLGRQAFDYICSQYNIYVPTESVDAYKTADYWKDHTDHIYGYNFE